MVNACLFSGGKDSTLALHKVVEQGTQIDLLITVQAENEYSYMFHHPNIDATRLQADALGIPQIIVKTKGLKEEELIEMEEAFVENEVKLIVSGAIASTYQKERIERIAKKLNIKSLTPLWGIKADVEYAELIGKYDAIVTQVSAEGLDQSFLGAKIDNELVARLRQVFEKYKINMLFEGGEAETYVLDAPLFKKKVVIDKAEQVWDGKVGRYLIEKAHLVDK
ncbi:MAG: diphthine--ammonia ligase [Candidatus Micrarchaeota archaeon]|nr:diphthine--ammonia ligase [Candidatus Micrarchaeota archaeon]